MKLLPTAPAWRIHWRSLRPLDHLGGILRLREPSPTTGVLIADAAGTRAGAMVGGVQCDSREVQRGDARRYVTLWLRQDKRVALPDVRERRGNSRHSVVRRSSQRTRVHGYYYLGYDVERIACLGL